MKVGSNIEDEIRRAAIILEEIRNDNNLMMDANQKRRVDESIHNIQQLTNFNPWRIEEPTSPDDILGYKTIAKAVKSIKTALYC